MSAVPPPLATSLVEQRLQQRLQLQRQLQLQQHDSCSSPGRRGGAFSVPESLPQLAPSALPSSSDPTAAAEKHPKGKRKRTATKDKIVLEAAYAANPKPDKLARLEIVHRVSLNEKEVQIWFQNRRQNDRRKSRPLSPQELAALRFGGMRSIASDPITSRSVLAEPDKAFPASDPAASQAAVDQAPTSSPQAPVSPQRSSMSSEAVHATPQYTSQSANASSHVTPPQRQKLPFSQDPHDGSQSLQSFSSSVGYLSNRWNLGSSFSTPSTLSRGSDDSFIVGPVPSSSRSSIASQKASQSCMRLSLSLEGKAELVQNVSSPIYDTPSKSKSSSLSSSSSSTLLPSFPQARQRSFQRSRSALPTITLPPISTLTSSLPPRLVRHRSRDVHAWELCADVDTRDELTTQAELESNGSAVAAISLLRSTSGILHPSGTKRNAPLPNLPRSRQAKKPKLGRTSPTVARLENTVADPKKPRESIGGKLSASMLVSPTGSDKENWSPPHGHEGSNPHEGYWQHLPSTLKMQKPRRLGRAFRDQKSPSSFSNRANAAAPSVPHTWARDDVQIFRDPESKMDAPREVVGKLARGSVSPSKKGDMDCVAGLLSLSQGAWR